MFTIIIPLGLISISIIINFRVPLEIYDTKVGLRAVSKVVLRPPFTGVVMRSAGQNVARLILFNKKESVPYESSALADISVRTTPPILRRIERLETLSPARAVDSVNKALFMSQPEARWHLQAASPTDIESSRLDYGCDVIKAHANDSRGCTWRASCIVHLEPGHCVRNSMPR